MWLKWGRQGMHSEFWKGNILKKWPLGILRRWEDNIKVDFRDMGR
jgi:hypothetical protein